MDAEEQHADPENPFSTKNETSVSPNSSQDAAPIGHQRDCTGQSGCFGSGGDRNIYSPTIYVPQAQAYYRGYDNAAGEWEEYLPYMNAEGPELGSPGPHSPVTTPLPSVGGDAQLYSPQQFLFSGPPYYQQLVPPSVPYITSPTPVSQPELTTLVNVDQQGDNMLFGPRPSFPSPLGSFGRGSFPGNPGTLGFNDLQQGFDGLRS
ncbi:hypothetical protein CRYUN_Cryun34aG0101400 [Craigia yunnanensis]